MKTAPALSAILVGLSATFAAAADGPSLKPKPAATSWTWDKENRRLWGCAGASEARGRSVCVSLACDYKSPTLTLLMPSKPKGAAVLLRGYETLPVPETNTPEEKSFSKEFRMHARTLVLWGTDELGKFAVEGVMNSGLSVMVDGAKTDFGMAADGSAARPFQDFHEECGFDVPG